MKDNLKYVMVEIGAGPIGQAFGRRVCSGKHILLADLRIENTETESKTSGDASFKVSTSLVDISSRHLIQSLVKSATSIDNIHGLIHVAALLMGQDGAFITGSDFLMDGGVTASYWYGELSQQHNQ